MAVVADALAKFEAPINEFVTTSASQLASAVESPLRLGAILYLIIAGVLIMQGRIAVPIGELLTSCIKIAIVYTLATKTSDFQTYVTDIFHKSLPDEIGTILLASGSSVTPDQIKSGAAFDALIQSINQEGANLLTLAGYTDVGTVIFGYVFMLVGTVVIVLISSVVIYAKLGLAIVVALGPLFIACALFNATRNLTGAWLGQVGNFVILQVLVYALFGLLLTLMKQFTQNMGAGAEEKIAAMVSVMGIFGMALFVAKQLPSIAASLSQGGVSIGSSLLSSSLSAGSTAGRAAARSAGRAASSLYSSRGAGATVARS